MKALKIALIPALLALFAGAAMANDAPPDAKLAAKEAAAASSAPKAHKKHQHAKKADSIANSDAPPDAKIAAEQAAKK